MDTIRKNITLTKEQNDIIERFIKNKGLSFSAFLRNSALEKIKKEEDKDLLEFLRENSSYVSDFYQKEFDNLDLASFKEEDFSDLKLDEIL